MATSTSPSTSTLDRNASSVVGRVVEPHPLRWTKQQYHQMDDIGLFQDKRVELIEGEIIEMTAMELPHWKSNTLADRALRRIFQDGYIVTIGLPISIIDESEPEPDVAVIRGEVDNFDALPSESVVALVIEVSVSTLAYDLGRKADLYARAGIADYWVLDVDGRGLIVHREPRDGKYQSLQTLKETDSIAPLEKPDASIRIVDLLP